MEYLKFALMHMAEETAHSVCVDILVNNIYVFYKNSEKIKELNMIRVPSGINEL